MKAIRKDREGSNKKGGIFTDLSSRVGNDALLIGTA
jgi:hypothetical protein